MNTEELDKLRLEDIDFFARRYSELFGEHFDKNTYQEKEEFYKEIKKELLEKAPKYVLVDNDPMYGAQGESYVERIEFLKSSGAIAKRVIRIHELFHSYNYIQKGKQGLRDFDNGLVLKNLDEGATEMFAQMICGNEGNDIAYSSEVKLTRFLTSIVGERTMIRSTRGNPHLLCETTDRLLGRQDFLQQLEKLMYEKNKLISQSFGKDDFAGTTISSSIKMLSELKLEAFRGKDDVSMLFDAVEESGNQELYNNIYKTDDKFGYNVFFHRSLGVDNNVDINQPTLANVQRDILKAEIDELDEVEDITLQTVLELEIKKFLYDKISYQEHFIDHSEPEYGIYELTSEDRQFSKNYRSELDGESERLGGILGLLGPGNRVYSLENTPYMVSEKIVKNMYLPEVSFNEIKDFRLELWAEKLNIAQTRELLDNYTKWIYNAWYKENFPAWGEETFRNAIEEIKKALDKKEKGLVGKYKSLEIQKQQKTNVTEDTSMYLGVNEENVSDNPQLREKENIEHEKDSNEEKIDVWMNRFSRWYVAIDKFPQSLKTKFVKIKSDIVEVIRDKIKETKTKHETNENKSQTEGEGKCFEK